MKNIVKKLAIAGTALGVISFALPALGVTTEWCFFGSAMTGSANPKTYNCGGGSSKTDTTRHGITYFDTTGTSSVRVLAYVVGPGDDGIYETADDTVSQDADRTIVERNQSGDKGIGINGGSGGPVPGGTGELDNNNGREVLVIDLGINYTNYTNWMIRFHSIDADGNGEEAQVSTNVFFDLSAFYGATQLAGGDILIGDNFVYKSMSGVQRYLYITEGFDNTTTEDILLSSIKADLIPTPAMVGLLGLSLVGLGFAKRRK